MAKLTLKSENQIIGDMASTILASTGLNDLNPGSILLTLLQTAAQEDFQQYYQMLQIIRNYNLDTTTGSDLENRAFEYGLTRESPSRSTGKISILREAGFEKIATNYFIGTRARIAGDTELFVNDASAFPTSGTNTIILGRGTPNEEEVTYTGSPTNPEDNTNFFKITLDSAMTNDHALEETIILKQGANITIPAGTVVLVPASGKSSEVRFTTVRQVTLLAGEDQITDVDIKATQTGIAGNIGVNAINGTAAFPSPPFPGLRAVNTSAFSNGRNKETDTRLRNRIKSAIQAISQSTKAGISNAITGLVDPTTAKRVVSSNIILPDNVGLPVKIYLDDGTGFEPTFSQQGQEILEDPAVGGEQRLQLDLFPLVKAQVETTNSEPYDMSTNGLTLTVSVGNESETITFFTNNFAIPEAGTAEEIATAINNSANLIEARTSQVGTKIVINAKRDENEQIQVIGGTANTADKLNFAGDKVFTLYLYKNDKLLSKDGITAAVDSGNTATYDFSGPDRDLSVTVDGKSTNVQTITIKESDFASPAAAAQATAQQVADIINSQLAGAIASEIGGGIRIVSNTLLSSDSKIKINVSDANTVLGFPTVEVVGSDQDYKLNPELGIVELSEPLVADDKLTSGTRFTRAFLTAGFAGDYTLPSGQTLQIIVDGSGIQTITLPALIGQSASAVADIINSSLVGGQATTRTISGQVFLEIQTNTFDDTGSIEILSGSTANTVFSFETDSEVVNLPSHTAYQVNTNAGPYDFVEGYTLVIVLDNSPAGKTYVIPMDFDSVVTSGTSTSTFAASGITSTYPNDDDINSYYVVFKSGNNTTTETVESVVFAGGNTYEYRFSAPPTNFEDFAIADQVTFENMQNPANDGNFLITSASTINTTYTPVLDRDIANPSVLTPSIGDRYLINTDASNTVSTNDVDARTFSNPDQFTPTAGDRHIIASGANSTSLDSVIATLASSTQATQTHGFRYLVDRDSITGLPDVISIVNDPSTLVPVIGDRYIVGSTPLGGWGSKTTQIAQYVTGDPNVTTSWTYTVAVSGNEVLSTAGGVYYYFAGGAWEINEWQSHDREIAEYNGVGTPGWVYTTPNDEDVVDVGVQTYQFNQGAGNWELNEWGGKAGQVAFYTGASWVFSLPVDKEVRNVIADSAKYQYDLGSNTWDQNDWGGDANSIAEWNGSSWDITVPSTNDVVAVQDEVITLIFNASNVWVEFLYSVSVTNPAGVAESGSAGDALIGQRRFISDYNGTTGAISLSAPTRALAAPGDSIVVLPSTRDNVVAYLNNPKITSLSNQAFTEVSGPYLQISSKQNGSDGYVQITGGRANEELQFSTTLVQGLQAYNHYVGLIKLVHQTVYGDEADLVTFPGVGAAGIKFQILPPTVQEVAIQVELSLAEGISLSQVENDVKTEIITYINNLGVGDPVILSNIVDRVVTLTTVRDIDIILPTENVAISDNELARTKASLITVETV